MKKTDETVNSVQFEEFVFDPHTGELLKNGEKVNVNGQPLQILARLLERPGEMVTREEFKEILWPDNTHVDYDHGLRAAVQRLRAALEDSPDNSRFIETIPRRGYRYIGPPPSKVQTVIDKDSVRGARRYKPWLWAVASMVLILIALSLLYPGQERPAPLPAVAAPRPIIAVLPFEDMGGESSHASFAEGLTEDLIGQLGRLAPDRLGVLDRVSSSRFRDVSKIAYAFKLHFVLHGSVRWERDRVRVSAQLVQIKDRTQVWAETYEREVADFFPVQKEIAESVSRAIERLLPADDSSSR